jgi:hypothetical protein
MTVGLVDTWNELVTVGLLGTDRRDPPELPPGPLADTVADALRPTPQGRLLTAVAATVVVTRCGAVPAPPTAPLQPPEPDHRPLLPLAAAARWHQIVSEWPVLEAEWLAVAAAKGWRPAPDVLVAMLRRHGRSPVLAAAVLSWGGAPAAWLIDHVPDLGPSDTPAMPPSGANRPLPVPAELENLLDGSAGELAAALTTGLVSGAYRWSHRAVLLNAVARAVPQSLPSVITALRRGRENVDEAVDEGAPLAMWESLIELATVRLEMLAELDPIHRSEPT